MGNFSFIKYSESRITHMCGIFGGAFFTKSYSGNTLKIKKQLVPHSVANFER